MTDPTHAVYTAFAVFPFDRSALSLDDDGLATVVAAGHADVEQIDVMVAGYTVGQRDAAAFDAARIVFAETYDTSSGRIVDVVERFGTVFM